MISERLCGFFEDACCLRVSCSEGLSFIDFERELGTDMDATCITEEAGGDLKVWQ